MDLTKKTDEKKDPVESTRGYLYYAPECDIYEDNDNYVITFDIPGIEKDDINLKVEKEILSITAEFKNQPVECYECIRDEMDFAGYQRSFNLNGIVDTDKINADYKNGSLTLTLPKKEKQKTKEIQIKVS